MINVICSDNKIIYNAYHLVKAFWPEGQIDSQVEEGRPVRITVMIKPQKSDSAPMPENHDNCRQHVMSSDDEGCAEKPVSDNGMTVIEAGDIRELYGELKKITGKDLPWGMLTGVRPTKLATKWIIENTGRYDDLNRAETAFAEWFYEDRRVSRQKSDMAFRVALRENRIISDLIPEEAGQFDGRGYSLYIGIPFCPTVCSYCSFSSGAISSYKDKVDDYIDALCNELEQTARKMAERGVYPTTVYMGGGTPTSLTSQQLDKVLTKADELFGISEGLKKGNIKEFTVEAGRPDSINRDKLEVIKAHHVTRISINPQTMQQKTLDLIGRRHTVEQIKEIFALAREMGFDNINMDLIMGLEGETNDDVKDTLRQIEQLHPDSLTVHSLAVKRASAMGIEKKQKDRNYPEGHGSKETSADICNFSKPEEADKPDAGDDRCEGADTCDIAGMIEDAYDTAVRMGMNPYYLYRQKSIAGNFENIGYAVEGKEGLYNILIMEEVQSIIACGAGASSKIVTAEPVPNPNRKGQTTHMIRSENVKNIDEYIKRYTR